MTDHRDDFQNDARSGDGPDFGRNEDFVRRVLGSTSGSPCRRAEEQLPDLIDGRLQGMDRQLVQAHLEHCEGCRELAVALSWATPLLPDMAEVDPGPEFTAGVLARTTQKPLAARARQAAADRLPDRLRRWWQTQVMRPGFAAEFAYAATLILVLLTAVPGAPLRGTPGQALDAVNAGVGSLPVVENAVADGLQWVFAGARRSAATGWSHLETRFEPLTADWRGRVDDTTESRFELTARFKQTVEHLEAGRLQEAGYTGKIMMDSIGEFWRQWWSDHSHNEGERHE